MSAQLRSLTETSAELVVTAKEGSSNPSQLISFAIGDDLYGVDIMAVREIKGWTESTPLPHQPEYVCGVLNLRGVVVPIVDLRYRFGQGRTEPTPLQVIIIVQAHGQLVGLLADCVIDIVSFDPSALGPVPRVAQAERSNFLQGLLATDGAMIALIDLSDLLAETFNEPAEPKSTNSAM